MNSYNGNLGKINKEYSKVLLEWLDKWDIPYDEIFYGKPWPGHKGFYVDDRTVVRMNFSRVVLKNWMIYAESLNAKIDRGNKSQKNKKV